MLQLAKTYKEASFTNVVQDAISPNKVLDKTFAEDLKVIIKATNYITNPTTRSKVLEFYLSALIAKYAEDKITHLFEVNLQKALTQVLNYGRESERSANW